MEDDFPEFERDTGLKTIQKEHAAGPGAALEKKALGKAKCFLETTNGSVVDAPFRSYFLSGYVANTPEV